MLKWVTQALDRGTIRMASHFRPGGRHELHHAAGAEKLLNDPEFLFQSAPAPPHLVFHGRYEFHFPSLIASPWPENNLVRGRLFRAGRDWKQRPSVILLHGWNAERQYHWQFPFLARRLTRAGVNAAMFELPFHGGRRPSGPGAIQNFISNDLVHMLEATRQSLSDARALLAWLVAQGSPSVGFWGISLGGWLAGFLCSTFHGYSGNIGLSPATDGISAVETPALPRSILNAEDKPSHAFDKRSRAHPSFAVLLTPIARMEQAIDELDFCAPIRSSLGAASSVRLDALNLASHKPFLPGENLLIVESQYDLFAPVETIENLWQAWGRPEIWRLPHGHISILLSPFVMQRIVRWVQKKASATSNENDQ